MKFLWSALAALALLTVAPAAASAHEVYVLSPQEISGALAMPSPNPFSVLPAQDLEFLAYGALVAVLLLLVLRFSVSKFFERLFDPVLMRLKQFAPLAGRLTLGLSLMASGYYGALFGPELPLSQFAGGSARVAGALLAAVGLAILVGWRARFFAGVTVAIFALAAVEDQLYMLTYANYLGEALVVLVFGSGAYSLDRLLGRSAAAAPAWARRYSYLALRVLCGAAIIFASFYAKFLHSNLALDTVSDYHLTNYFHFTPLFLVLGAFIVEALIGLCFVLGVEIRFAALVFTGFLVLSISFFGEAVWPHIVLFGMNLTLFLHGYDECTVEKRLFGGKGKYAEPVL